MWINDPCIVVGKHQNALAEANYWHARENRIPVLRRITGGGAVYQDRGNLNFSFITTGEPGKLVDYRRATQPVVDFLQTLGIAAEFEGKSNLVTGGRKFSGNSAHVFRNRVIHHGTILFDADLERLGRAITRSKQIYSDNSVKSVRATVTNLAGLLQKKLTPTEFSELFFHYVMNNFHGSAIYSLSEEEIQAVERLAEDKYRTWEWTYGYSPDYTLENEYFIHRKKWRVRMEVVKARIVKITTEYEGIPVFPELNHLLEGLPHREETIRETLGNSIFAGSRIEFDTELFIRNIF